MLNIIKARADNIIVGQLIDLDVDGFIIDEIEEDDDNGDDGHLRDSGTLRDLEVFENL